MNYNIAKYIRWAAEQFPQKKAVVLPNGQSLEFCTLDTQVDETARKLQAMGCEKAMRVAVFVRPGLDFPVIVFALFKLGAVPVFIDPGMRFRNILSCIGQACPDAMIGVWQAHVLRKLFPRYFKSVEIPIVVGGALGGRFRLAKLRPEVSPRLQKGTLPAVVCESKDAAAVIFTSGSTGTPKGVVYTHGVFDGQRELLRKHFEIAPDETDLVVFPLFVLFTVSWGVTAVIAKMNPARPAKANGKQLADLIDRFQVTHTSGSPAIWRNVMQTCIRSNRKLPSLKRILMAGAPVPQNLIQDSKRVLVGSAYVATPYGATEALPLTSISDSELMADGFALSAYGKGTCVGKPFGKVQVRVIAICEGAIRTWNECRALPAGEIGEIVVKGPLVTREYFRQNEATERAKILDEDGFWHRMGDVGYFDESGRLWFCGRKDHRIQTVSDGLVFPVALEGPFNAIPGVFRAAVVGIGQPKQLALVVVAEKGSDQKQLLEAIQRVAQENFSQGLFRKILFRKTLPVDVRHNIKIDRIKLAEQLESKGSNGEGISHWWRRFSWPLYRRASS